MGRIVSGIAAAVVSDWMLRMGVSTATTRKTFQAVGNSTSLNITSDHFFLSLRLMSFLKVKHIVFPPRLIK